RPFMCIVSPRPATETYTLSLHDALPICERRDVVGQGVQFRAAGPGDVQRGLLVLVQGSGAAQDPPGDRAGLRCGWLGGPLLGGVDRKSTRLNSSHVKISYAVFCLKKKKK